MNSRKPCSSFIAMLSPATASNMKYEMRIPSICPSWLCSVVLSLPISCSSEESSDYLLFPGYLECQETIAQWDQFMVM